MLGWDPKVNKGEYGCLNNVSVLPNQFAIKKR